MDFNNNNMELTNQIVSDGVAKFVINEMRAASACYLQIYFDRKVIDFDTGQQPIDEEIWSHPVADIIFLAYY